MDFFGNEPAPPKRKESKCVFSAKECRVILRNLFSLPPGRSREKYRKQLALSYGDITKMMRKHEKKLQRWFKDLEHSPIKGG